jgi:hypothetical protein
MPNAFAYLVFYTWPLVIYIIFRKQPLVPAIVWSMVLGYILIPDRMGFDLPAVPTITKYELTTLSVALMCWLKIRSERQAVTDMPQTPAVPVRRSRARGIVGVLLLLMIITPLLTVFTNTAPIIAGPRYIPGLRLYDALSMISATIISVLPFLLGRRFLNTTESHVTILKIMCFAMMAYSIPALWEIRMSPQLNRIIYGYTTSMFAQHMRAGGFRPLVFMDHGLSLGLLLSMSVLATVTLWRHLREGAAKSSIWFICLCWLLMTLVLAKSVGALVIAVTLLSVVLLTGPRLQLLICAILAGVVLLYPMLRGAGYIPTDEIYAFSLERSAERAQSLQFRFGHEDSLLAKANEKPLLGWGNWGRNRVFDETTGEDLSVTDGIWIIVIGMSGWVGYIATFGLLTVPILFLAARRRVLDISIATAGLAIVLTANLVDMLPNSGLRPITWLIAGALMGRYIEASRAYRQPHIANTTQAVDMIDMPGAAPVTKARLHTRRPRDARTNPGSVSKSVPPKAKPAPPSGKRQRRT